MSDQLLIRERVTRFLEGLLVELVPEAPTVGTGGAAKAGGVANGNGAHPAKPAVASPVADARVPSEDDEEDWPPSLGATAAILDILGRAGLLSRAEREEWQRRFTEARRFSHPAGQENFPLELGRRVEAVLEQTLAKIQIVRIGQPTDRSAHEFRGALEMARALGVVNDYQHGQWWMRMLEAHSPGISDRIDPDQRGGLILLHPAPPEDETEEQRTEREAAQARQIAEQEFNGGALVHVIAGPPERHDGLRILSLVVRERAVEVNWHLLIPRETAADEDAFWHMQHAADHTPEFALTDDHTTDYGPAHHRGGGAPGGPPNPPGPHVLYGTHAFHTPVPPNTHELQLTSANANYRLTL